MEDPWGPGCDGHSALSNGDCEEIIDANGDRYIPAAKVVHGRRARDPILLRRNTPSIFLRATHQLSLALLQIGPTVYDSFSGNTNGLFKGQTGQALLDRLGSSIPPPPSYPAPAIGG